ncbi:MAG: rod shape-determining protein RodA [Chitinophagales bacterium]|nr:rod shape-determining protein RodA [Chitinophagales bacterium]
MSRNRNVLIDIDWLSIFLYLILVVTGWIAIYAASYSGEAASVFNFSTSYGKQMIWIFISLAVGICVVIIDSKFYTTFAYVFYLVILITLIIVLFIGEDIKGARSWISFGSFNFQPSELAKFATSLAVAKFLSSLNIKIQERNNQLLAFALILIPMALIIIQGDMGSALVFSVFILVFYREGLPAVYLVLGVLLIFLSLLALLVNKFILIGILLLIAILSISYFRKQIQVIVLTIFITLMSTGYIFAVDYIMNNVFEQHQRDRINVLVGKGGNDWNIRQSKIAIGSGGLTGKGFLNGTQTKFDFVPEQSTDFIFCTIGEEFGFLGSAGLIAVFVFLILRLIFIAERQRSKFSRIYGYCVACIFFFHFLINIGMTLGILPVIGIPLPLISYGGSSLIGFTILLFILIRLDAERLIILR